MCVNVDVFVGSRGVCVENYGKEESVICEDLFAYSLAPEWRAMGRTDEKSLCIVSLDERRECLRGFLRRRSG